MSMNAQTYSSFEVILDAVRSEISSNADYPVLIGIDGGGGSGKSTLAKKLAEGICGATLIHLDDFADWTDDSNWQLSTFAERALKPLLAGITSKHQRYDWTTETVGEWFEIPPAGVAIIEGVTSLRVDLREYWKISIWVGCPRELRLERGVTRDGEAIRAKWVDEWIPGEDQYFLREKPWESASLLFDGSDGRSSDFTPPV
jgi:uridine kinase